jgi:hypothetical protein
MARRADITPLVQNSFYGGWATDDQLGSPSSFAYSRGIDFRKKPTQFSVLPVGRKETGGVVTDLIQDEVMVADGTIYAIGSTGNFYKRTPAGIWSRMATLTSNGGYGLSYRRDIDAIYVTSQNTVSEYSPISNSPTMKLDKFAASRSADSNCYLTGGTKSTAITTSISEADNTLQYYKPDIEPLVKIGVKVITKGTGDWTLVVHDGPNNVLGTATITNANLTDNATNYFSFASQIRQQCKPNARTYHFHITSTVADGTIASATDNDMNTCDYEYWADRLIMTTNGMHVQATFGPYQCFGNGDYMSVWEPLSDSPLNTEWLRHKLVFSSGMEVCGVAEFNEYLAIACEYRSSSASVSNQAGAIYFWDGTAAKWNYRIPVPEGSPYSLHEHKNILYYISNGALYGYANAAPVKLRTLPNSDSEFSDTVDQTVVYPNMFTVRRGIHLLGYPSTTTNQSVEHGVYSRGSVDKNFSESFGFSYPISTGTLTNTSGNLKIGMVKNFGDMLHVSWQDGASNFGVDVVDNYSDPQPAAIWQGLTFDNGQRTKLKTAVELSALFDTLTTGETVQLGYRIDGGAWVDGTVFDSGNRASLKINKRFYYISTRVTLGATTTTPEVNCVTLIYNNNYPEAQG